MDWKTESEVSIKLPAVKNGLEARACGLLSLKMHSGLHQVREGKRHAHMGPVLLVIFCFHYFYFLNWQCVHGWRGKWSVSGKRKEMELWRIARLCTFTKLRLSNKCPEVSKSTFKKKLYILCWIKIESFVQARIWWNILHRYIINHCNLVALCPKDCSLEVGQQKSQ